MTKVKTFKMPWKTNHFNKRQRVFVEFMTGNQACRVRGKHRGKNRWISAWIKWGNKDINLLNIREIELSENDYNRIMGI